MRPAAVLAWALLVASCDAGGQLQALDTQEDVIAAAAFVEQDLRAALADAQVHKDDIAAGCYTVLLLRVQALPARTEGKVVGAISAYQKARNARRLLDGGITEDIHVACAPLVSDARGTVSRLVKLLRVVIP